MTDQLSCLRCGASGVIVVDSRVTRFDDYQAVRRRRHCNACKHRWLTYELPAKPVEEITNSSPRTAFERAKAATHGLMAIFDTVKSPGEKL
jgi:transcriptional regulator NrdR family protein